MFIISGLIVQPFAIIITITGLNPKILIYSCRYATWPSAEILTISYISVTTKCNGHIALY